VDKPVQVPRVGAVSPVTRPETGQAGASVASFSECQQEQAEHYEVITSVTALHLESSTVNHSTPLLTSIFYLATQ